MSLILKTTNLTKMYGKDTAAKNINMSINKGDIYGLIGKNGAGKTTVMRMILGMAQPTSGTFEYPEEKKDPHYRRRIGSIIEGPAMYPKHTAFENLKRYSLVFGGNDKQIKSILDFVGLGNVGNKAAGNFSLGMRQRLGIAIALLGDPDFLVLDEPVNGLDPAGIMEIRDLIQKLNQERGITFLISSHLLDELARVATKFGIMNQGDLVEEVTTAELNERFKKRLMVYTNDNEKAQKMLAEALGSDGVSVNNDHVEVIGEIENYAELNKRLVYAGLDVSRFEQKTESLEQYFIERVGR